MLIFILYPNEPWYSRGLRYFSINDYSIFYIIKDVEDNVNKDFTIQNGKKLLAPFFYNVQRLNYEDSLAVTDIDDLAEYIYSLSSMTTLSAVPKKEIHDLLTKQMVEGVLSVPKEYGMFCCRKGL